MSTDTSPERLVSRFINSTGCHVFLTGRAGTGKTTLLREIVQQTHKKVIVAAPTGIAAINAGGITLHSLFQLPFGTFLPSEEGLSNQRINIQINTPRTLIKNIRMHETRRRMIREMELLIIDEVSMLRADLLDAIDNILRHIRHKRSLLFGGVQILFIGDLLQLPPVVKQEEWDFLGRHYQGMYFFQSRALREQPPIQIELLKIYRQSDPRFINLLNRLRDDVPSHEDMNLLNRHVDPAYDSTREEGCIFLTTHNHKADRINQQAIARIGRPAHHFDAVMTGDFSEAQYPVEYTLTLKEGAQVMFIKNDHTGERRYFNGRIGTVDEVDRDRIVVRFSDDQTLTEVERYTWENKKYNLNRDSNEIEEKVAGTFSQYPLRLAWAITVHKSQGLTFERAVIDVSAAFAPGQVYVALSRLTGLNGLILNAPIPSRCPGPEADLVAYTRHRQPARELLQIFERETLRYVNRQLIEAFDLQPLADTCKWFISAYNKEEGRSAKQRYRQWAVELFDTLVPVRDVAARFLRQLHGLPGFSSWDGSAASGTTNRQLNIIKEWTEQPAGQSDIMETGPGTAERGFTGDHGAFPDETGRERSSNREMPVSEGVDRKVFVNADMLSRLHERAVKATAYFFPVMNDFSKRIFAHITAIEGLSGTKGYITELGDLEGQFFSQLQRMQKAEALLQAFIINEEPTREKLVHAGLNQERSRILAASSASGKKGDAMHGKRRGRKKAGQEAVEDLSGYLKAVSKRHGEEKPRSAEVSLALFREGNVIEEIALIRSLAISTVAGHLAECVERGMIAVDRFLEKEKLDQIKKASEALGSNKIGDIMGVLGDEFSYVDVRFALAVMRGEGE